MGGAMQAGVRPYVLASAAMVATGAIAGMWLAQRPLQPPVSSIETRLVDADSVLNIPVNLFDDIANIPSNEIQGIDVFSDSLFFSGDWWVPNATNLWGTDPGDLGHYMGLLDIALPFAPQISGLDQPEIDPTADADGTAGLAQQIALLAAAELPVSGSCDAETCFPMTPPNVITGSTAFDRDIGFFQALDGQATTQGGEPFGLFSNWFQVPLSDLTSGNFTFTPSDDAGLLDPSPDTGPGGAVLSAFGFDGTTGVDGTGTGDYMPWAGDTFQLNLLGPFEDYYNSLLATPSTSGIDGTGIDIPSSTSILDAFQNLAASSVVAFDPYVMGSPACPVFCDIPTADTQPALVQDILAWDPSNTTIQDWLTSADSTATTTEAEDSVALLQTGYYNLTPEQLATYDADLTAINPELPYLFTNDGIVTDPNYLAFGDGTTTTFDPTYGGYDPNLDGQDLLTLFTNNDWNYSSLDNINTVGFLLDPAQGDPGLAAAAAVPAATDASSLDPSLSTDLSGLLSSFGTTAGSDLLSQLATDFSTQFATELATQLATDLGTQLPTSLLSMF
jgi:hypothetical protein